MAHSDAEVGEALVQLAINKYDFDKTAKDTGKSVSSLKRWAKSEPKKGVAELLERAIERMLLNIPTEWKGNDWSIAVGILMDKWLLMQGEPTSRTETIARDVESLTPQEKDAVIAEVRAIIAEARGRRVVA